MAFTSVEIIALIVIIVAAIKMAVLLVKPQAWMSFAGGVYSKKGLAQIVSLILAGVVLYYLIQGDITIVEILAVTAFVSLLMMFALAPYIQPLIKRYQAQIKKGSIWKENWLYTLIWVILLVWGLLELFV